jgi:hypothetical protein
MWRGIYNINTAFGIHMSKQAKRLVNGPFLVLLIMRSLYLLRKSGLKVFWEKACDKFLVTKASKEAYGSW